MTSIPVPAPEAAPAEPSGTKIGPVVIAFVVGTAVSSDSASTGGCTRRRAMRSTSLVFPPARQRRQRWPPVVMALVIVQTVTAMGTLWADPAAGRLGRGRTPLVGAPRRPDLGAGRSALPVRPGLPGL